MPNEYEAFFNKASKLGADATRNLAPEERARRAMEASYVLTCAADRQTASTADSSTAAYAAARLLLQCSHDARCGQPKVHFTSTSGYLFLP